MRGAAERRWGALRGQGAHGVGWSATSGCGGERGSGSSECSVCEWVWGDEGVREGGVWGDEGKIGKKLKKMDFF